MSNIITKLEDELESFISDLKNLNCSQNTIESYKREVNYFIDFCRGEISSLKQINKKKLMQAIEFREKMSPKTKISDKTKTCFLNAVRQFLMYVTEDDTEQVRATLLSALKRIRIKPYRKVRQYLEETEINRIINYLTEQRRLFPGYITSRNSLLVKFLYYGGMRISEALNVKWADINESEKAQDMYMIKIVGKGKQENYVFIMKSVIDEELSELKKYITGEYLMMTNKNNRLNRVEAYIIVSRIMRQAGVNKRGLHIYRHSLGFRLAAKDIPIIDIQEILRHKNINTTRIYVQREETKKLDNLRKIY